jgi:DNA-binding transcriptional regulator PaaX
MPGLWVRPDNLRQPLAATNDRLRAHGLEDGAEIFVASSFSTALTEQFRTQLWPLRALAKTYESVEQKLTRSLGQLDQMPHETALVQTFLFGGEAIRVLATDPLLPQQMLPSGSRAKLTATMLLYDEVGREIWKGFASEPTLALVKAKS